MTCSYTCVDVLNNRRRMQRRSSPAVTGVTTAVRQTL